MSNSAMGNFVYEAVGVDFRTDHIVIARHEEVYRKTQDLMMEANYYTTATRLNCDVAPEGRISYFQRVLPWFISAARSHQDQRQEAKVKREVKRTSA
eukprot:scaffold7294_cov75-Phaeocystis_antarctica.AAC.2